MPAIMSKDPIKNTGNNSTAKDLFKQIQLAKVVRGTTTDYCYTELLLIEVVHQNGITTWLNRES